MIYGIWNTRDLHIDVYINDKWLCPEKSKKIINHSPDGFSWGYGGSGPAQLALAILLEYTDEKTAVMLHQSFKWDIISHLPKGDFELSEAIVISWIKSAKERMEICT